EREQWCRTIDFFTADIDTELVDLLIEDGILFDWSGLTCPVCGKGPLGDRCIKQWASGRGYERRCSGGKNCGQQIRQRCGNNREMIEGMARNLDVARQQCVGKCERGVACGDGEKWLDVEADESVFATVITGDTEAKERGQWAGVVDRGEPDAVVLFKTESDRAAKNAPGPGAVKKSDWQPFLSSRLKDRKVISRSGSAGGREMRALGVLHDAAIHCGGRVGRGGKLARIKPVCSKIAEHKLPIGNALKVKAGAQIIDGAWKHVRKRHLPPASAPLSGGAGVGQDLWAVASAMVLDW
ncbi:unnamed protein product, partial [Prorocentrum cordatum]